MSSKPDNPYTRTLAEALAAHKMTVAQLSRLSGVPKQTLYSAISRGSLLREEAARAVAEVLHIPADQISPKAAAPEAKAPKTTEEALNLFSSSEKPDVLRLLLTYYRLTGEGRRSGQQILDVLAETGSLADPGRTVAAERIQKVLSKEPESETDRE